MKSSLPKKCVLEYYRDAKREWRWKFTSPNGRKIACSGEGYKRMAGAENGFAALRDALDHLRYIAKW